MGKFGRKEDSEGNPIQGDSGFTMPETGFVDNCTFVDIEPATDQEGNKKEGQFDIVFKQPNGAEVRRRQFEPGEKNNPKAPTVDQQIDNLVADMKHICTKFSGVDDERFHKETDVDDFKDFMKACKNMMDETKDKDKFRLAVAFNREGYIGLRKFPNYIENMADYPNKDEATSLQWNSQYDFLENPKKQNAQADAEPASEEGEPDW